MNEIDLEDENTAGMFDSWSNIDDEYANAVHMPLKILLTTSCNPSASLVQFAKVFVCLIFLCFSALFISILLMLK